MSTKAKVKKEKTAAKEIKALTDSAYRRILTTADYNYFSVNIEIKVSPPERCPKETNLAFKEMFVKQGYRKPLSVTEKVKHEMELGKGKTLEEWKKKQDKIDAKRRQKQPEVPRRLCGICGQPECPWSE